MNIRSSGGVYELFVCVRHAKTSPPLTTLEQDPTVGQELPKMWSILPSKVQVSIFTIKTRKIT